MTNQELYDRVKKHLLSQMKQSASKGHCLYRGPDGLKCAIGCLIPDEKYAPDFEGKGVGGERLLEAIGLRFENIQLAQDLQATHDMFYPCRWEEQLADLAVKHGLQP